MLFKLCITTDTAYAFSGDSSDIGPCGTAPLPVPGAYVSGATEEEREQQWVAPFITKIDQQNASEMRIRSKNLKI